MLFESNKKRFELFFFATLPVHFVNLTVLFFHSIAIFSFISILLYSTLFYSILYSPRPYWPETKLEFMQLVRDFGLRVTVNFDIKNIIVE